MNDGAVIDLLRNAVTVILVVSAPVLIVSTVVGLLVSIFQTTTSIQEQTLTFLPKLVAVLAALIYFGSFLIQRLMDYSLALFAAIPDMTR